MTPEYTECAMCSLDGDYYEKSKASRALHATMLGVEGSFGSVQTERPMLVDQGATQSFMRKSFYDMLMTHTSEMNIQRHICHNSGKDAFDQRLEIMMVAKLPVTLVGRYVGKHWFMIVNDDGDFADIM